MASGVLSWSVKGLWALWESGSVLAGSLLRQEAAASTISVLITYLPKLPCLSGEPWILLQLCHPDCLLTGTGMGFYHHSLRNSFY